MTFAFNSSLAEKGLCGSMKVIIVYNVTILNKCKTTTMRNFYQVILNIQVKMKRTQSYCVYFIIWFSI